MLSLWYYSNERGKKTCISGDLDRFFKVTVKLQSFRLPTSVTQNLHGRFGSNVRFYVAWALLFHTAATDRVRPRWQCVKFSSEVHRVRLSQFHAAVYTRFVCYREHLTSFTNHAVHDSANFVSTYYYLYISVTVKTSRSQEGHQAKISISFKTLLFQSEDRWEYQ